MIPHSSGNGSGKFKIHQQDMGGWVRIFADDAPSVPEDYPLYLSHALTEWFRQRPHLHVCSVVGVVKDGNTAELHAWYNMHVFPDLTLTRPQTS